MMADRVIFFDEETKATMTEDNGHWVDSNSNENTWILTCIDKSMNKENTYIIYTLLKIVRMHIDFT